MFTCENIKETLCGKINVKRKKVECIHAFKSYPFKNISVLKITNI